MGLVPFLKWPGGKRWFITKHASVLPTTFNRYIEPFLGSASVFFYLEPTHAVLGDLNAELIDLYRAVAWRRNKLESQLRVHQRKHCWRYYYQVRESVPEELAHRAARTLYLNRTAFNGMYRVNRKGEFNVPKGVKSAVVMETDNFSGAASLLRRAKLRVSDFEPLIDDAKCGDFVFADPPYVVGHNNNGFVKYNEKLFRWCDQVRLADALSRARNRGVKIIATNAAHNQIRTLYGKHHFQVRIVERYSSISGKPSGRCSFRELVISANCD